MPFTPFHLGPGALFKGIGADRFSFMVFGGAQVLMDLEAGYRMLVDDPVLHGPSHTFLGAALIGAAAMLSGKPISEFVLRAIRYPWPTISWTAAATGAFVGTFSHVLLDATMHADMMPWSPLDTGNPLLGAISVPALHLTCAACGAVGGLAFLLSYRRRRRRAAPR